MRSSLGDILKREGGPGAVYKSSQETRAMRRKEATIKMAAYIRFLGNKVPIGTKAAHVEKNLRAASTMHKLANAVQKHGNLFEAVDEVYATKSAAYRHKLIRGLAHGLAERIKQAMNGLGVSQHPSAGMMGGMGAGGGGAGMGAGGMATTSPISKTVGM